LIRAEARSSERSVTTKHGTPKGDCKDLLDVSTKLYDGVKLEINSYMRSAKASSENLLTKQLKNELKVRLEKKNCEMNSFMKSNLIQEAHKAIGLKLLNLRKEKVMNKEMPRVNMTQSIKLSNEASRHSLSTRNNLRDTRGLVLSQDEARVIPEYTVKDYIDKQMKSMQEELLRALSEKLNTDIEQAINKIKLNIQAINQTQSKKLALKIKDKLTKSLNRKLVISPKQNKKQSAEGNEVESQQSGLKMTQSRNNPLHLKQSVFTKEDAKSLERKKLLKIITSFNPTLRDRQKLLSEEPKSLISSEHFLTDRVERRLNITKELTEYNAH
jgi:hypothetical protein